MRALLDLLLPERCAACDAQVDAAPFCPLCACSIERAPLSCRLCGMPLGATQGDRCRACQRQPPVLAEAAAPYLFGGALAQAIRRLKWGERPDLGRLLGPLLPRTQWAQADLVVPVPLHPRRLRQRGFNQAAVLALGAGARLSTDALTRIRDTATQSGLSAAHRRHNVRGAFRAHPARVRGKRVLLIDDVLTTGATAHACAEALLADGARHVGVLTLARAVP